MGTHGIMNFLILRGFSVDTLLKLVRAQRVRSLLIGSTHLRMARAGLGWTLVDLSNRSGVNPNTISRFESGRGILSSKLARLEAALRTAGIVFIDEADALG